jgi:acetyl-CoA carboxylase biotin carboxyl carrier protein
LSEALRTALMAGDPDMEAGHAARGKRDTQEGARDAMADLRVRSEIAGSVWKIAVAVGDSVAEEDPLVILESMKMEIPLLAPRSGVIKEILVAEGEPIAEGDVAVIIA